jgi:aminoglycoside phosphotransferase (APT) family kinase protein
MPVPIALDDIVPTRADADPAGRVPLVVIEPLLEFLDANGLGSGPPSITPIGDGHSNVTYRIERGDTTFVFRRPPRPPLPPSAHDVLREARMLRALAGRARVPSVLAVCDDPSLLGAPFYIMEYVEGAVLTDHVPESIDPRRASESLVDALAELHEVDWQAAGLGRFGNPDGYLSRQLQRFAGLWERNKTREIPAVESIRDWLIANMPESSAATVVHGDYRFGNAIVGRHGVVAILDWEMSTIGDPLADLGYLCALWSDADDPERGILEPSPVTRQPGFLRREELIARYEQIAGRRTTDIRWYQALAVWKAIVFMEGNYKRALAGTTDDPFLAAFGEGVMQLVSWAETLVSSQAETNT